MSILNRIIIGWEDGKNLEYYYNKLLLTSVVNLYFKICEIWVNIIWNYIFLYNYKKSL